MSTEQNKELVRRWIFDVFEKGDMGAAAEIFTADFQTHDNSNPAGWPRGPEGARAVASTYHGAFPDLHYTIEDQVAEGDRVATRWSCRALTPAP